jgi:hypothetical protein
MEAGQAAIQYWQLDADNCWQPSDAAAFHRSDDAAVPTTIFIHGNHMDPDSAVQYGWDVYQHMEQAACGRPFRLVIWSWSSERTAIRPRPDSQYKAELSDLQSYYVARLIGDMRPDVPVCLIGYSFGTRPATGAVELLAGGPIAGLTLPQAVASKTQSEQRRFRLVLIAAASDADWLLPGHRDGLVMPLVERILAIENGSDRVLKYYSRLYGRGGPEASGYTGPQCCPCDKVEEVDVSCSVGRRHDWRRYNVAPELLERLGWYTFLEPGN